MTQHQATSQWSSGYSQILPTQVWVYLELENGGGRAFIYIKNFMAHEGSPISSFTFLRRGFLGCESLAIPVSGGSIPGGH